LTNYKTGKLNKEAERIRANLADHFNIPVYVQYFVEDKYESHNCLICGNPGIDSGLDKPNKICLDCNTIFNYVSE